MTQEEVKVDENDNVKEIEEKIIEQVEYYFGDINLRRDKFLKEKVAENDGWVGIDVLLTFKRMAALTSEVTFVANAIKKSGSELLEVSEDGSKVKRITPISDLTEEQLQELHLRTVHFKGFPLDATLDAIKAFASQWGKVEAVEMRKNRLDKTFKGCCMVTYAKLEEAEKAIAGREIFTDAIPKFLRENKVDYFKRKAEFRRAKIAERNKKRFGAKGKPFDQFKDKVIKDADNENKDKDQDNKDKDQDKATGDEVKIGQDDKSQNKKEEKGDGDQGEDKEDADEDKEDADEDKDQEDGDKDQDKNGNRKRKAGGHQRHGKRFKGKGRRGRGGGWKGRKERS